MKKFQQSMHNSKEEYFDVIVAGAGPAGSSCAYTLSQAGLKVALIDKSDFPRVKVCGDALTYRAVTLIKEIFPALISQIEDFPNKTKINSARFVSRGGNDAFLRWNRSTYNCNRADFDTLLLQQVLTQENVTFFKQTRIENVEILDTHVEVTTENGLFKGAIVVGCDGAHSVIARKILKNSIDRHHHSSSVRAYFKGVHEQEKGCIELYFTKKFIPAYFWVFPVNQTDWNVGLVKMPSRRSNENVNLREAFFEIIEETPELKSRFKDATMIGKLEGFGLPLGSKKQPISGQRFLLCGDAASLIDPMWGNGIDNGLESGRIAANHIIQHHSDNKFTKETNADYDKLVYAKLRKELRFNTRLLRIYSIFPWFIDAGIFLFSKKNPLFFVFKKFIS